MQTLSYTSDDAIITVSAIREPGYGAGKEIGIYIHVENISNKTIDVNPAMISGYYMKGNKEKELKIYTYNEYIKKAKKDIFWFGPENTEQVNKETTVRDERGNILRKVETETSVYTGANDVAKQNAEQNISNSYLRRHTLEERESISGLIVAKNAKMDTFFLKITISNYMYVFECNLE